MKSHNMQPLCIIDRYKESGCFEGISVYNIKDAKDVKDLNAGEINIIATPVSGLRDIHEVLKEHHIQGRIIPIWEIIRDQEISDRLEYLNR